MPRFRILHPANLFMFGFLTLLACSNGSTSAIMHPGGGTMILIPAGTFDMGCTAAQQVDGNCQAHEAPVHSVTLTHDFYMGETEVTQAEYQEIIGTNPSYWANCGTDCPVEYITWHEVAEYANALSVIDGLTECFSCSNGECSTLNSPYTCDGYRLPTEAEWEYAARAGTDYVYSGSNIMSDVGWYSANLGLPELGTHPVAQKVSNDWGLFDMSGNVMEWTWDWYAEDYYSLSPLSDPEGSRIVGWRVARGGDYAQDSEHLRISNRTSFRNQISRDTSWGFRLVRSVDD